MKNLVSRVIVLLLMAASAQAGELAPGLIQQLDQLDDQDQIKVLVVLKEQAPVDQLDQQLRTQKSTLAARHHTIVSELRGVAQSSQKGLLEHLEAEKALSGISGFTPHWIINAIVVKGTVGAIIELADHPDVLVIEPDLVVEPMEPVLVKEAVGLGNKDRSGFIAPGVETIGAPRVWRELGIDGTGTLVANMDSGVDGNHPALSSRWRGHSTGAATAWRDLGEVGSPNFPFDSAGHGTHVMGTICGATAFDTLGVAPGAEWIANNAVASSVENFDNAIIAGFEWFADPDGDPETHDDVPDVCHNSWGVIPEWGYPECDSAWWEVIDNCEAAGVVVTISAGNEGPSPGTIRIPGDRASSPTNCFTVGSTSINFPNAVSYFSSRGPSLCGGEYTTKPEVMAPGEDIISCFPGGTYTFMSGTSMAGPHVAGIVALMRQAAPNLDVTTIKEILMDTAHDLGPIGDDNSYGRGLVDAYAAVTQVLNNVGTVEGLVTDIDSGLPLAGVIIRDTRGNGQIITEEDGQYSFTIVAGPMDLAFSAWGYVPKATSIEIPAGEVIQNDVALEPMPLYTVSGLVEDGLGNPVAGAQISVVGTPVETVTSGSDGSFSLQLPGGPDVSYTLLAVAEGLAHELVYIGLSTDQSVNFQLPLPRYDGFESGDFQTFAWQQGGGQVWTTENGEVFEGSLAAQSGNIDHGEHSALILDYYVSAPGEMSFYYSTDCEIVYDNLKFYLDGQLEGNWSGQISWSNFTANLDIGWHNLRWEYAKDGDVSVGRDAAWIDLVELPGTGQQPAAGILLDQTELTAQLDAGTMGQLEFSLGNDGGFPLDFTAEALDAAGGQPVWMSLDPTAGTVYPGNWHPVQVEMSGFSASVGINQATIRIHSSDPENPVVELPLTLQVAAVSATGDLPRQLSMSGAVPNPFNPATNIHFSMPREAQATLRVYDVKGRPVRTLVKQSLAAGQHEVHWNGQDSRGQNVASGVYFARLQTLGQVKIKSMVLVR